VCGVQAKAAGSPGRYSRCRELQVGWPSANRKLPSLWWADIDVRSCDLTYRPLPDYLTIQPSSIDGLGLFATRDIKAGTVLGIAHVRHAGFPQGWCRTPLGGWYNHSDYPNCVLVDGIVEGLSVKRLKTVQRIPADTELTCTYTLYKLIRDPPKRHISRDALTTATTNDIKETRSLRDEWAKTCLTLAESQDWESVEFKAGHRVVGGQHGWRIFCGMANLTQLRDQTYPALIERQRLDRPRAGYEKEAQLSEDIA
jgi:hypothetical protein